MRRRRRARASRAPRRRAGPRPRRAPAGRASRRRRPRRPSGRSRCRGPGELTAAPDTARTRLGRACAGLGRRARARCSGLGGGGLLALLGLAPLALLLGLLLLGGGDGVLRLGLLLLGAALVGDRAAPRAARAARRLGVACGLACAPSSPDLRSLGGIFPECADPNLMRDLRGRDRGDRAERREQARPHQPLDHVVLGHVAGSLSTDAAGMRLRGRRRSSRPRIAWRARSRPRPPRAGRRSSP